MAVETKLVTVSEFLALPDPPDGRYELRGGEVVLVPPVKLLHTQLQARLVRLLISALGEYGTITAEFPFQPTGEFQFRFADVAFASAKRMQDADPDGYLQGAPDLVIEILSPSNTFDEVEEKRVLCLSNGCQSYWIVDPKRSTVEVRGADFASRLYLATDSVPLPYDQSLRVADVFARP